MYKIHFPKLGLARITDREKCSSTSNVTIQYEIHRRWLLAAPRLGDALSVKFSESGLRDQRLLSEPSRLLRHAGTRSVFLYPLPQRTELREANWNSTNLIERDEAIRHWDNFGRKSRGLHDSQMKGLHEFYIIEFRGPSHLRNT